MEVQFGPNAVDESNLLYKLQRKIKVFNTSNALPNRGYNLLTTSSKYGIVFVASPQGVLSVYNIKDLIDDEVEPQFLSVKLAVQPTHIAVNCDQEWLAVVGGQMLLVYKVADFQNPNVGPSASIKCDINPSTFVSSLQWNPCVPDTIAIVYFDGTLVVCQVSTMQKKQISSTARCLCWSPKGKQLVTGNNNGTLCQYKPDLSPMKSVPAPNLFEGAPVEALSIYWISTYQFAVVFRNASDNSRPAVTIVSTPKGGAPSCINYEDICYSMGSNRPWYYYLHGLAQWNIILSSSSNSMEIATIASKDGASWLQWCQNDEARPELPLTDKKQENYPVGLCIDTCAAHQLPWGENEVLPPMPFLLVVSQTGLLTIFNIINLDKSAPQICTAIQPLTLPANVLTSEIPDDVPKQQTPEVKQPQTQQVQPQPQQFTQQPQPVAQQPQPVAQQQSFGQQQPVSQQQAFGQPQPVTQQQAFGQQQPVAQQQAFGQQQPVAQQQAFGQQQPVAQQPQPSAQQPTKIVQPIQKVEQTNKTPLSIPQVQGNVPSAFGLQKQPTQTVTPAPTAQAVVKPSPETSAAAEATAALKAEQEKVNKAKINQELKNMLVKEVNDFQLELYKFMKTTRETQNKIHNEIITLKPNAQLHTITAEQLKQDCSMEDLRESVIQLKLELVRTCAVVAEARTHAEAKDMHEWTQVDPLTTKRFASIKKLMYYVENQLEQVQKALDYKFNEMSSNQYEKPGSRMIRPILDEVYQPLVKQQEILSRQQAVLKTLKNTLNECNMSPMIKTKSLLRSTPFKNKDPLSKLTKNILNMSIEPQNNKDKELSSQKLDALRDMLSNHRPRKIKPVTIELNDHLESLREKYEKGVKERAEKREVEKQEQLQKQIEAQKQVEIQKQMKAAILKQMKDDIQKQADEDIRKQIEADMDKEILAKIKSEIRKQITSQTQSLVQQQLPAFQMKPITKIEAKPIKEPPINVPAFSPGNVAKPTSASGGVARSLFIGGEDQAAKTQAAPAIKPEPFAQTGQDYSKNDVDNLLQNVCSPTAFSFSKPATTTSSSMFSTKPIAGMANMFSKFTDSTPPEIKPTPKPKVLSEETGEIETTAAPVKPIPQAKENKPMQNIFSIKPSTPLSNVQNVPDLVKGNQAFAKAESLPKEKEAPKENISKQNDGLSKKDSELKPFSIQTIPIPPGITPSQPVFVVDLKKPNEIKIQKSLPSSFFAAVPTTTVVESQATSTTSTTASYTATLKGITPKAETVTEKPPEVTPTAEPKKPEPTKVTTEIEQKPDITQSEPTATKIESVASTLVTSPVTSSVKTTSTPSTPQSSNATAQSIFSSAVSKSSMFGTPAPGTSLFGSSQVTVTSTPTASFGSTSPSTQSIFGTSTTQSLGTVTSSSPFAATSAQSVFSAANKTAFGTPATSGQSLFSSSTTQASAFGGSAVFGSQPVFGAPTTQSSAFGTNQSVFGSTTTQASVFGTPSPTTQSSLFGTTTTTQSLFGSTAQPVFGTATSQASVFGATSQASVFGTATSQASVFGTPATSQPSVFGSSTPSPSVFGTAATTQSASVFGDGGASLFASASISTTSAPTQSGGNLFGSSSPTVFGSSNTNVFGGKSTFSGSNATAASIFGGGGATTFGQKPATDFWSGGNSNASGGFGSSGFGQPATTQASLFGTSGGSFSQPSTGQPFGSPQKPSVFGSPQQQPASGFGGSAVFGSSPSFGSPPSFGGSAFGNKSPSAGFGSSATFGGSPAFGATAFGNTSPGKVFGGAAPAFGSPTQSNATFENLATQNTLTFGNLAQQSGQAPQPAPSFNTSPSFTGWRS